MTLHFLTGSKNKFEEVRALLPEVEQLEIDLPEIQELDAHKVIEAKLVEALKHHTGPLMAEDTSLYIDGMNGLPGPLCKWFLKSVGPEGFVKLSGVFGAAARAKTIIGYADGKGSIEFFQGETLGKVVEPRGEARFGWDGVFEVAENTKTYAEMGMEEKNKISHRAKAMATFKAHLAQN